MPDITNHTPFPNFRYYSTDNLGAEFGIVIVKATYDILANGHLAIAEEQAPMVFTDLCHGAVNESSLWHPSDLVPVKPRTDIIVNAVAHAPGGKATEAWTCGIRIEGREIGLEKTIRVTGPRAWLPRWSRDLDADEKRDWKRHRSLFKGWELSKPSLIERLPLHHEYAYGGLIPKGEDEAGAPIVEAHERNPLGRGWLDPEWTDHSAPQPAPQIEATDDPVREPYRHIKAAGFAPIPPAWLPRRPLGGTFDDDWKANVWPNWPADYDFAYHNAAHPDLIFPGPFDGDETIRLSGLLPGGGTADIRLPARRAFVMQEAFDGALRRRDMALDTVFLDIAADDPSDRKVFLSWRTTFPPDVYSGIAIHLARLDAAPPSFAARRQEEPA